MTSPLNLLIEELKNLKQEGMDHIYIQEDTLTALKQRCAPKKEIAPTPTAPAPINRLETVMPTEPAPPKPRKSLMELIKEDNTGPSLGEPKVKLQAQPAGGMEVDIAPIPKPTPFELPKGSQQEQWNWLRDKVLNCPVCNEHINTGKKVVFGVGNTNADIFFCGEAPGADEEIQGEPFVGPAGQLLTKIINAMGFQRSDVYIGNIMNWRPETNAIYGNRPPSQEEMTFCLPYLQAQVDIVKPKIIVALGATAVNGLLGHDPKRRMGQIRGQWQSFNNTPLMITFHPSYLLRNGTKRTKRMVWEDMMLVMEKLGMSVSEKQRGYFL